MRVGIKKPEPTKNRRINEEMNTQSKQLNPSISLVDLLLDYH